jgi:membrane associated rhomboid family serine protease
MAKNPNPANFGFSTESPPAPPAPDAGVPGFIQRCPNDQCWSMPMAERAELDDLPAPSVPARGPLLATVVAAVTEFLGVAPKDIKAPRPIKSAAVADIHDDGTITKVEAKVTNPDAETGFDAEPDKSEKKSKKGNKRKAEDGPEAHSGGHAKKKNEQATPAATISDVDEGMAAYFAYVRKERAYVKRRIKNRRKKQADHLLGINKKAVSTQALKNVADREQVSMEVISMTSSRPVFIVLMMIVQTIVFASAMLEAVESEAIANFALNAQYKPCVGTACPLKFDGNPDIGAVQVEETNPWLGPAMSYWIKFGALYTPCMREHTEVTKYLLKQREAECGADQSEQGFNSDCAAGGFNSAGYSCCVLGIPGDVPIGGDNLADIRITDPVQYRTFQSAGTRYGMTRYDICAESQGWWLTPNGENTKCCDDTSDGRCFSLNNIVLRPCCFGNRGRCKLLTESQCAFRAGSWSKDAQLCSDVSCLQGTCELKTSSELATKPHPEDSELQDPDQGERFILPLFYHAGFIHYAVMMMLQLYLGVPLEKTAGFLRTALVFFTAGIGGNLVSGLHDPYSVSLGSNAAVFGFIGVKIVETVTSWKQLQASSSDSGKPKRQLVFWLLFVAILLFAGSLPFVDNYAQIGGLVFGMVAACVFLPYITFSYGGNWTLRGRKICLGLGIFFLVVLLLLYVFLFYAIKDTDFCPDCNKFNCADFWPASDARCSPEPDDSFL